VNLNFESELDLEIEMAVTVTVTNEWGVEWDGNRLKKTGKNEMDLKNGEMRQKRMNMIVGFIKGGELDTGWIGRWWLNGSFAEGLWM
jgi:hypothetical protein